MKLSSVNCKMVDITKVNVTLEFNLSSVQDSQRDVFATLQKHFKEFVQQNKSAASLFKTYKDFELGLKFLGEPFTFSLANRTLKTNFTVRTKDIVNAFNNPKSRSYILHSSDLIEQLIKKELSADSVMRILMKALGTLRQSPDDIPTDCVLSCSGPTYTSVGNSVDYVVFN